MRKILVALTAIGFSVVCNHATADAVLLGASPSIQVYGYPETINVVRPGVVKAWTLYDMAERQFENGVYLHSVKSLNVFDCKDRRIGVLNDIYFSERSAKGMVVWNGSVEMQSVKWQHIPPKSLSELKYEFACGVARQM